MEPARANAEPAAQSRKPILCLDFDGVLHSYVSGWQGADVIPDAPVPGAIRFLLDAVQRFEVHIFSSRSHQPGGIGAMLAWIRNWTFQEMGDHGFVDILTRNLHFPTEKPPAHVSIDDRAITFTGTWPDLDDLANFKPWNRK